MDHNFSSIAVHLKLETVPFNQNIVDNFLVHTNSLAYHCQLILFELFNFDFFDLPRRLKKLTKVIDNLQTYMFELTVNFPDTQLNLQLSGNPFEAHVKFVCPLTRVIALPDWITFGERDIIPELTEYFILFHKVVKRVCETWEFNFFWENFIELKRIVYSLKVYHMDGHGFLNFINQEE